MRFVRSCFCLFLCCVICSVLCFPLAYALDIDVDLTPSNVHDIADLDLREYTISTMALTEDDYSDVENGKTTVELKAFLSADRIDWTSKSTRTLYINNMAGSSFVTGGFNDDLTPYAKYSLSFYNDDDTVLFNANSTVHLSSGESTLFNRFKNKDSSQSYYQAFGRAKPSDVHIIAYDMVGGTHEVDDFEYVITAQSVDFTYANPDYDIQKIEFYFTWNIRDCVNPAIYSPSSFILWEIGFRDGGSFYIDVTDPPDENTGLLNGIIEWLRSIKDGITNVFTSIAELPSKIVTFIVDGLKDLFIPDSEYMTSYKDKWDELLSSRFGAVYEAGTLVTDYVGAFQDNGATDNVEIPSVSINVSDGEQFTFGGYTVGLIPEGFGTIVNILKTIVSIVCTFAFVNALKNRFNKLLGGDES